MSDFAQTVKQQADIVKIVGEYGSDELAGPYVLSRDLYDNTSGSYFDFSVFKQFPLWKESQKLEFRSEFFNLFNTPQFNNPNGSIGSTAAGTITSAGDKVFFHRTSRQIQFAMKLYF